MKSSTAKRILRAGLGIVAGIAFAVFLFFPVRNDYFLLFFGGAILVLLLCFIAWKVVFPEEEEGYWPEEPRKSSLIASNLEIEPTTENRKPTT
jgi:hypothetical protein